LRSNSSLWLIVCWRDSKSHLLYRNVRLPRSRTVRYGCLPEGGCRICLLCKVRRSFCLSYLKFKYNILGSTVFFKFDRFMDFPSYINTIGLCPLLSTAQQYLLIGSVATIAIQCSPLSTQKPVLVDLLVRQNCLLVFSTFRNFKLTKKKTEN
jgi:hypothetical protein